MYHDKKRYVLDKTKVSLLKELLSKTQSVIVLSSSWRIGDKGSKYLKIHKIKCYDKTPILSTYDRHYEIEAFLNKQEQSCRFVVLDDDDDAEVPKENMGTHNGIFIDTKDNGLTIEIVNQIVEWF